jgi:hypothetical protein
MKAIHEIVEAVVRALELDEAAIARRKAFLEFTDDDVARLKALHRALQDIGPEFAQAFYDHLLRFEESKRLISDTATLERLKRTQAQYFDSLTAGDYGWEYIRHRLLVGWPTSASALRRHGIWAPTASTSRDRSPRSGSGSGKTPRRLSPPCSRSSKSCCWTWGWPSIPTSLQTGEPSWR